MIDRDSQPRIGDEVTLAPSQLVAGGDALAKLQGFPIFVPGLYPGDTALVEIIEVKKGFARGEVRELISASPARKSEPCPIASSCGGCDWTSLRLDHQLAWKREILIDSLRRIGKFDPAILPPVVLHASPLNYRLRSRLHYDSDQEALGFFASRTNQVVPLSEKCEVVGPQVVRHIAPLADYAKETGATSIDTFENGRSLVAGISGEREGEKVSIEVNGFRYRLSTEAFFQVNRHLLSTLLTLVATRAGLAQNLDRALDLYAGVGFFTLPLAQIFGAVSSVEASSLSHRYAKQNARNLSNVSLVRNRTEQFLSNKPTASFVMVDPPRAGLSPEVIEGIHQTGAGDVCYLSCDPVTFSRDAARLVQRGWKLASLDLVDLFPNTHHIETLSSFIRER